MLLQKLQKKIATKNSCKKKKKKKLEKKTENIKILKTTKITNVKISHAVSENLKNPRVSFSLVVEGWCVYFDMEGFGDSEVDFAWRSENGRHSAFDVLGSDLLRVLGLVVVRLG